MKKLLLTSMFISMLLISGCTQKDTSGIPQSVQTYKQLNLTPIQNKQIQEMREKQHAQVEAVRKELEAKRIELLGTDKNMVLTPEQKQENFEKYRKSANELSNKILEQRDAYDKAFMEILNKDQKKIYSKYMKQRNKEIKRANKRK